MLCANIQKSYDCEHCDGRFGCALAYQFLPDSQITRKPRLPRDKDADKKYANDYREKHRIEINAKLRDKRRKQKQSQSSEG